ncbi:MAG: ubiquinol-cytochrome c reductase iron-sulfur subunit [Candidatus Hydrothermarchaeota archaeon]
MARKGITRRYFLYLLGGGAIASYAMAFTGALIKFAWSPKLRATASQSEVEIAKSGEIPVGEAKLFKFQGKPSILIHLSDGYYAFGAVCTHLGCVAKWKDLENNEVIYCPCHIGKIDPRTGEVLAGPIPSPYPKIIIEEKEGAIFAKGWKDPEYVKSLPMYA